MVSRMNVCRVSLSIRSLLAAAGVVACVGVQAQAGESPKERLNLASLLLNDGKVVQARALLSDLAARESGLSDQDRERATMLARNASRKLKALAPEEVSLQTAEDALLHEDIATALAQANAVITSPKATNEQVSAAKDYLSQATQAQTQIAPAIDAMLQEAVAAYEAGHADEARNGLSRVQRSGVALSATQSATLEACQTNLVAAMNNNTSANAGMMQPGVVRRHTTPPPPPAPENQPAPEQTPVKVLDQAPAPAPAPTPEPAAVEMTPMVVHTTNVVEAVPVAQAVPAQPVNSQPDIMTDVRRWESQALLAQANFAMSENRLQDAINNYNQLLHEYGDQLNAQDRATVEQRLGEARVRLGGNPGTDVLQGISDQTRAAQDMARTEFDNGLNQATRALEQGDTIRARQLAERSRVTVAAYRNLFSNDQIEDFNGRVDNLLKQIDSREAEITAARVQSQAAENRDAADRMRTEQTESKANQINLAIDRVRSLQAELKYEDALQIVESQILFLDPINPTGLILRDVLRDAILYRRAADSTETRTRNYGVLAVDNLEAGIPPLGVVTYPKDWPAISESRGTPPAFAEAEENRRALAMLQTKRIPVNFNETPLENVVTFLAAVTQLNVDVDYPALEAAGVDRQAPVTLNLTNVPVETILNRIVEKVSPDSFTGAAWNVIDGVLTISSKEQINKQKSIAIYDIRDLIVEVPNYTNGYELDLQQALQQAGQQGGGGGGGQSPFEEGQQQDIQRRTLEERTNDIIEIITTNVDSEGWRENGGDVGYIQQLGGLLIITNTPANHRSIHGLLTKLREYRAMQINVETRFLLVSQDFFEQIGFDLDVYLNAKSNSVRAARATQGNGALRNQAFFNPITGGYTGTYTNLNGLPNPTPPQVPAPLPSPWSPIGNQSNSLGLAESLISTDLSSEILNQAPALGIAGEFLDDIQVDFLIKATQADRRTVSLNAPRLTFTNGQISNIVVATQIAYVADLTPQTNQSSAAFDPVPGRLIEGVTLTADGTVSADRRYVTMNVDTGVSRLERLENQPVAAVAGGQLVNSASTQSFIQLPVVTVTRVQTTVTVPDQGTIMLGGQRLTTESEVETGVPVLSKIPVLNRFFTNRVLSKEDQSLLILLKPTILIQNEEEERAFPGIEQALRYGG